MNYPDWQVRCDAVVGLTWAEQYPLPGARRDELWALVKDKTPGERARIVEDFRRRHLEGESAAPAAAGGQHA